jgi:MFS transporter, ACS family, glucarate transporter
VTLPPHEPEDMPPTRARFIVAAWLCGLTGILYLDRICMAQAVTPIRDELNLSNTEASYVAMAFTLAYGLFGAPAGRWGDRSGPRSVLTRIVLAWSAFTALTGVATGLLTLVLVRFLFGAAEAGGFPNAAKVVSRWFPVSERGRVQGLMLAFAQIGAVAAPAATAELIEIYGWRESFFAFGLLGVVWALGFWVWFRDDPASHRGVNRAELAVILDNAATEPEKSAPLTVPWGSILSNRGIILLCVIITLGSFFTYFFYTWFPTYLHDARGLSYREASRLASLVNAGSAVGMLVGGWIADRLSLLADPVRGRRYLGAFSFLTAAVCLFLGIRCDAAVSVAVFFTVSFCVMHFTLPNWWSVIIPQGGRHVGTVFGLANGVGAFGALASQAFVGVFTDWQKSRGLVGRAGWDPLFDVYVCVLLGGAAAWLTYRFVPLDDPTAPPTEEAW